MRKKDYEILADAIKKHGNNPYLNHGDALIANDTASKIAHTFAKFAHVDKVPFLAACGFPIAKPIELHLGAENAQRGQT